LTIDKPREIWYNIDTKEREVNKMKVYEVYIEGYCTNGDRGVSKYLGQHTGNTFAEAARQACASRFGEESTKTYFDIRNGIPAFWGCRLYDNYADAASSFG
jgi:hypothetical protein